MEAVFPLAFTSGWASGINAYLVVIVLGVIDRVSPTAQIPDVFSRWEVIAVATVFFAMEFVADKVPLIDSGWDAFSTVVRPTLAAIIGYVIADGAGTSPAGLATLSGGTALVSHLVKAGTRLAVNTSPEPVSNVGVSLAEDGVVLAVVWFAIHNPVAAAVIAAIFLVIGIITAAVLLKAIRRGWAFFRHRDTHEPSPS